jgi:hypothetical protein
MQQEEEEANAAGDHGAANNAVCVRWREGRRQLALPLKADETKPII